MCEFVYVDLSVCVFARVCVSENVCEGVFNMCVRQRLCAFVSVCV